MQICFEPIGIIHTPFTRKSGMPIQSIGAKGVFGKIELYDDFTEGLKDLEGFSHIILIYHFHKTKSFDLITKPFLSEEPKGIFAIRSPKRPNPIGISVVKLIHIEKNVLEIENPDIIDGTPLLDIKPYIPEFDSFPNAGTGWLNKNAFKAGDHLSDGRFDY